MNQIKQMGEAMRLKLSSILAGGVMFSTSLEATDLTEVPSSTPKDVPEEYGDLRDIHYYNDAFDQGGVPYEPYNNVEKRK